MKLVQASMHHPVTVTMFTLASVIFGFVALTRLPWNLLPDISYPTLTLRTEYPDAAPAEVENLVTQPLEEAVAVVQGLRDLRSTSRAGVSEITLEFAWNTKMDYVALDVREKADLVELPRDVRAPVLLRYDPNLDPVLRIGLHGDKDLVTLRHLADRVLKKELEAMDGVASARVRGGLEEEIQVDVDEGKLAALGIPISTVTQFLDAQNVNASGGSLRDRDAEFLVRTRNEFENADELRSAVLFEQFGRRVRLEDVAEIRRGYKDREVETRVQGQEAVELAIYKEGDANTVQVAQRIKARLRGLEGELPAGVKTQILFDQSTFIESAVDEIKTNAVQGALLAILVLYLFLKDRRGTFIIGITIPLSIIACFFVMQQFKVTLNVMSLGGLALGAGMLIDNAIVILESISRYRSLGHSVWDATLLGASEVERAVTGSTFTTVVVFLPIIFVEGIAGQIFRDQALTVTASQIVSLLFGLTLLPVMAAMGSRKRAEFPPSEPGSESRATSVAKAGASRRSAAAAKAGRAVAWPLRWLARIVTMLLPGSIMRGVRWIGGALLRLVDFLLRPVQHVFDQSWGRFAAVYPSVLSAALRHRGRTLGICGLLAALAVALAPTLGVELVPQFSQGEFAFDLELPVGTPLAITESVVRDIEGQILHDPKIRVFFSSVGESPEMGSARTEKRENVAQLNVATAHTGNRQEEAEVIESVRRAMAKYPELRHTFRRPTYFSFQTPVEVLVFGHDLPAVKRYTDDLVTEIARVRGLRDVRCTLEEGSPEVQIHFRRDRVAALDLDIEAISRTLRNKIHGEVATKLKERDRQIDILVRTANAQSIDVEQVRNLVVNQVEGVPVPLSSVADVSIGRGPSQITRLGQQRAAIIRADLAGRDLGSVNRELQTLLNRNPPPETILASLGGQNEEIAVSFRSLLLAGLLAVFLVYLVMASEFESFLHPLVILITVPLGMVGVIFALAATRTPVSVVVLIGVILLAGIVVNNAIVLIEFVNQRRREGLDKIAALLDAGATRLRPIFMTTVTAVLGLVPMALGLGEGAEIRAPMAIAVIGGLSLATLLTLVVIPVLYATLDRRA